MKKDLVERLKKIMDGELPGEKAHIEMIPGKRVSAIEAMRQKLDYRASAVSIILCSCESHYEGILIKRTVYKGAHSGQIAFPGGKHEEGDEDLFHTAVRETKEEINVDLTPKHLVGLLTPVYIPVSNFMVHPYLFVLDQMPEMRKEEIEVSDIIRYNTFSFVKDAQIQYTNIESGRGGILKDVPFFEIEGHVVWGATALMMNELKHLFSRFDKI